MTQPITPTGKRLYAWVKNDVYTLPLNREKRLDDILTIEREAAERERRRLLALHHADRTLSGACKANPNQRWAHACAVCSLLADPEVTR